MMNEENIDQKAEQTVAGHSKDLDSLSADETTASPEIISETALQPATSNLKPATEMEVHHQTHHEGKKNWKSYFREFLMLFLAVFCGFLAEYQLEHRIDRERERNYIRSMVNDLRYDTSNFTQLMHDGKLTMILIDSLMAMLQSPQKNENTAHTYHMARRLTHTIRRYEIFDRTYTQMKSSGNLRLLRSQEVADYIAGYYADITELQSQQGYIQTLLTQYIRDVTGVFDPAIFHAMYIHAGLTVDDTTDASTFKNILQPPPGNPSLLPENKAELNKLLGTLHYLFVRILSTNSNVRNQQKGAAQLIAFLKNEYDL